MAEMATFLATFIAFGLVTAGVLLVLLVGQTAGLGVGLIAAGSGIGIAEAIVLLLQRSAQKQRDLIDHLRGQQVHEFMQAGLTSNFLALDHASRVAVIERLVSSKKIAEELVSTVIESDLFYSQYDVDVTFEHLPDNWDEDDRQRFLGFRSEQRFIITNAADHATKYLLDTVFFDIVAPEAGQMTFEYLSFTPIGQDSLPIADQHREWSKDNLPLDASFDKKAGRISTRHEFPLLARQSAEVCVVVVGFVRRDSDNYEVQARYATEAMKVRVTFPDPSYKPQFYFVHSHANDPSSCEREMTAPGVWTATIRRGALPYQGVVCTWRMDVGVS